MGGQPWVGLNEKISFFLLGLFIAFYGFAVVYMLNPELSESIGRLLRPAADAGPDMAAGTASDTPQFDPDRDSSVNDRYPDMEQPEEEDTTGSPGGEQAGEVSPVWIPDDREGVDEDITSEYTPPSQEEIVIPENVSGRNGYQQIQDEQEQSGETEAERLRNQLDAGYTGDGLEFDARYYPYYAMLNEKGQHLYRQIYANGNELYQAFAPVEAVTAGELRNIFSAVYNDHPELFWMETAYSGKYVRNGQCVEIDLRFNRTARDLKSAKSLFEENADQILMNRKNMCMMR